MNGLTKEILVTNQTKIDPKERGKLMKVLLTKTKTLPTKTPNQASPRVKKEGTVSIAQTSQPFLGSQKAGNVTSKTGETQSGAKLRSRRRNTRDDAARERINKR